MSERTIALYDATQHTDEYLKGDGVAFPATAVPSSDVNTMDYYEDTGGFTPALTFATPGDLSVAYDVQAGRYTRMGNVVMFALNIATNTWTHSTASGVLQITGMPFTAATGQPDDFSCTVDWDTGLTLASAIHLNAQVTGAIVYLFASHSGSAQTAIGAAECPSGTQQELDVGGIYIV